MTNAPTNGFADRGQEPFGDIPTDPDAFLAWSALQPRESGRYELVDGRVEHTMINATRGHVRVCTNLLVELMRLLDREQFDVASSDFAVRTENGVRGPDIVVDRVEGTHGSDLATSRPIQIAEILSPSSVARDMVEKQREYTALPSLDAYLVLSQDQPLVWAWLRKPDGRWPDAPTEYSGREATIPIAALALDLAMAAIFRGIPDAPSA